MYAIIATGGKQYKVAKGDVLDVEKLDAQPGDKVELPVLLLNDGKQTIVDAASLQDKKVTAEVVEQFKGEKVLVFKFKKRKRYHRANGHRQNRVRTVVSARTTPCSPSRPAPSSSPRARSTWCTFARPSCQAS